MNLPQVLPLALWISVAHTASLAPSGDVRTSGRMPSRIKACRCHTIWHSEVLMACLQSVSMENCIEHFIHRLCIPYILSPPRLLLDSMTHRHCVRRSAPSAHAQPAQRCRVIHEAEVLLHRGLRATRTPGAVQGARHGSDLAGRMSRSILYALYRSLCALHKLVSLIQ